MALEEGPHHICSVCGEISNPALLDRERRFVECTSCGRRDPYERLPPVLFLTGANGAGKSTLYRHLLGRVNGAVLVDQDLLWGIKPEFNDPASGYREFRTMVIALARRIASNGRIVVIEGTAVPWEYEALPERAFFSRTSYMAAVCSDDDLASRLQARPTWRQKSHAEIEGMIRMNQAFKEEGPSWPPGVRLVDTSRPLDEAAEVVWEWIRGEHQWWHQRTN